MPRPPALDAVEAAALKEDLWKGMPYSEAANKYKVSYQLVVGVKAGRVYPYVPWPDGSTGRMDGMRMRQITDARRFGHATRRGEPESEASTVARLKLLGRYDEISRFVKDKTGKSVEELLESFNKVCERIVDEEQARKHADWMAERDRHEARLLTDPAYKAEWEAWVARAKARVNDREVSLPNDQVNPDANEKVPWPEVVALAPGLKVVEIAAADEHEPSLRLAIQIVFKLLSPRQWGEDHCLKMIYSIKQKIENFWAAAGVNDAH